MKLINYLTTEKILLEDKIIAAVLVLFFSYAYMVVV